MLEMKQDCCQACGGCVENELVCMVYITGVDTRILFHRSCWVIAADDYYTEGPIYFTNDEWVKFAGKGWSVEYRSFEGDDGTKRYYRNRELHREDGPAIEYSSGSKCWYLAGQFIRSERIL